MVLALRREVVNQRVQDCLHPFRGQLFAIRVGQPPESLLKLVICGNLANNDHLEAGGPNDRVAKDRTWINPRIGSPDPQG